MTMLTDAPAPVCLSALPATDAHFYQILSAVPILNETDCQSE